VSFHHTPSVSYFACVVACGFDTSRWKIRVHAAGRLMQPCTAQPQCTIKSTVPGSRPIIIIIIILLLLLLLRYHYSPMRTFASLTEFSESGLFLNLFTVLNFVAINTFVHSSTICFFVKYVTNLLT